MNDLKGATAALLREVPPADHIRNGHPIPPFNDESSPDQQKKRHVSSVPLNAQQNQEPEAAQPVIPELPERCWRGVFQDYREAMDGTTECSDTVHFITLWAAGAVTLGRRVYMHSGDVIFPNVYLACHGPTGDKKTTGERRIFSSELLGGGSDAADVKIIRKAGSPEGFADEIGTNPAGAILFFGKSFPAYSRVRHGADLSLSF